jgi:UPF0755 protein
MTDYPAVRASRRSRYTALILLMLTLAICAGITLIVWGLVSLPGFAADTFGPASPGLGFIQRIRLSGELLLNEEELTKPVDPFGEPQPFEVILGETPPSIAARLQEEGLISWADAFLNYLQYAGLDTTLQAGKYFLSPAMSPVEIAHSLQDATPTEVTITVLPGWRLEEIAATLPTSGLEITPQEFLSEASILPSGYAFLADLPRRASLEGFLAPGSYRLPRQMSVTGLFNVLLDHFSAQLTSEIRRGFERQGLDVFEAVTLASIVERESVNEEEMPLIASVFLNRLSIDMKLDADSTVQYALGYNESQETWWTNPLRGEDLTIDSAYNTYLYPGLPPGPIANPSLNALRAVAFPGQTPYFYFRAACDGSGNHLFAETFEQHVENACP